MRLSRIKLCSYSWTLWFYSFSRKVSASQYLQWTTHAEKGRRSGVCSFVREKERVIATKSADIESSQQWDVFMQSNHGTSMTVLLCSMCGQPALKKSECWSRFSSLEMLDFCSKLYDALVDVPEFWELVALNGTAEMIFWYWLHRCITSRNLQVPH